MKSLEKRNVAQREHTVYRLVQTDRQTDGHRDRQIDRQTERKTDGRTLRDIQKGRKADG